MLAPIATIKDQFFDRDKATKSLDKKVQRVLSKTMAFVRRTAQFSMKSRKGTAPAGSPPYAHEKSLKRLLFFAYDTEEKSAVAGPVPFEKSTNKEIPLLMEVGGTVEQTFKNGGQRTLTYDEHPYMKPALDENVPKVADMFRGNLN